MMRGLISDVFDAMVAILIVIGGAFLIVAAGCMLFVAKPNGYYIKAAPTGHISQVYQDMRWAPDRLIFTGPNGQAWQVLEFVKKPKLPVPLLPRNKSADL